jgi:hypothetical protein
MFETLKKHLEETPIVNYTRKYHAGVDNINVMPLDNVLIEEDLKALDKVYEKEYKRTVDQFRTQCTIDHNDNVHRELNKIIPVVEKLFDVDLSNHVDARIWKDTEGFFMHPHTDNSEVEISVQIYLNNNSPQHCGTSYFYNGLHEYEDYVNIWTAPYKKGSGYLLLNTNTEVHAMCHPVPPGCSRTSLYLNFKRK